jgi:hypothetical protein
MLLIDQPPLPVDTAVIFDVSLTNGQKPIRAEGVVLSYVEPNVEQPGGVRVRFKRYGAATKAFIDRANPNSAPAASLPPRAQSLAPRGEIPAPRFEVPKPPVSSPIASEVSSPIASAPSDLEVRKPAESSGVHRKAVQPVAAPPDREALLNRLRARRTG